MNVRTIAGSSAFSRNAAAERLQKPVRQSAAAADAPAQRRDRLELHYTDVLKAEQEGYIEVGGKRFAVTEERASDMRQAYEQLRSRSEAKAARLTAAQNARLARQEAEAARMNGKSMQRASEIARRISEGGRVPSEDEYFLMTFSKELYQSAKMMAAVAEEQKDRDSVFEDDELTRMEAGKLLAKIEKDMTDDPLLLTDAVT